MDVSQQVPAAHDAAVAKGTLTATLVINGKHGSFSWRLKVSTLSGRVVTAQLAIGARGKIRQLALPLRDKCAVDAKWGRVSNPQFVDAILHSRTCATVTTRLNPKGEIPRAG